MDFNYEDLHFSSRPRIIVKPPGPESKKILERMQKYEPPFHPTLEAPSAPITSVFETAKGATVRDVDGNIFVDLAAGISVMNIGHCNPVVVEALKDQAEKLWHFRPWNSLIRENFLEKINDIMPGKLKNNNYVEFATSGSDATEGAIMLAKFIKNKGGIIAFDGAFHGTTHGALVLTANIKRRNGLRNLMPFVYNTPYPYCYRCPFNDEYPECDMRCVRFLENRLEDPSTGIWEPSAIFVEPIQGEGGYVFPPDKFLPEIQRISKEHNILLVVDEIQTGFCRTGKMFAVEHCDVTPDIMLLSKAMAAGFPGFATIILRKDLMDAEKIKMPHGGTFRSNHLAIAVANANIDFMVKNDLAKRSRDLGEYMRKTLADTIGKEKFVGDIRGKGLMIGIEFVKDKKTKEPFEQFVNKTIDKMLEKGYIVLNCGRYNNVIRLMPPIVITKEMIDGGITALEESIKEVEGTF
jgi:4-aminobutyrate aminotransferase-like enzyme